MLKHFQTFSPLLQKLFLLHCDSLFVLFLIEVLLNVLEGNLPIKSKHDLSQYAKEVAILISGRDKAEIRIKPKRKILASNRGLKIIALLYTPVIEHFNHLE